MTQGIDHHSDILRFGCVNSLDGGLCRTAQLHDHEIFQLEIDHLSVHGGSVVPHKLEFDFVDEEFFSHRLIEAVGA